MSTDTTLQCALGVGDRTLSDFRSDGLTPEHMKHLQTHVARCAACQARLDAFEAMAQALRAQPGPNDHARLWRNVQTSIAAASAQIAARHARGGSAGSQRSVRFWTAFGSIAAVVALAVGFVAVFASYGGKQATMTKPATPNVIHSGSLAWRQVTVPEGFPSTDQANESATHTIATIAQSDGNTAYACQASRQKLPAPRIWATHNAGESWSVVTPTGLAADVGGCRLWIDSNNSMALIVAFFPVLGPQTPASPDHWVHYASFDGGATWTKPAGLQGGMVISLLASAHGEIYVLGSSTLPGSTQRVYVSRDQMETWTPIDEGLPEVPANRSITQEAGKSYWMWVNPQSGEVLVESVAGTLWTTRDDGAHWTKLAYSNSFALDNVPQLSVAWTASPHFTICTVFLLGPNRVEIRLTCTVDDGKTWKERPILPGLNLGNVGPDGSIYAIASPPISGNETGDAEIYRLSPNSASLIDWQSLGAIPGTQNAYGYQSAPAGNRTVFWAFMGLSTTTSGGHTTTTIQSNYYIAIYP
jgi:hypothetical protein